MVSIIERQRLVKILVNAAAKEMLRKYDPAFVFEYWSYTMAKGTTGRRKDFRAVGPKREKYSKIS
jgi:hypothetical protein